MVPTAFASFTPNDADRDPGAYSYPFLCSLAYEVSQQLCNPTPTLAQPVGFLYTCVFRFHDVWLGVCWVVRSLNDLELRITVPNPSIRGVPMRLPKSEHMVRVLLMGLSNLHPGVKFIGRSSNGNLHNPIGSSVL